MTFSLRPLADELSQIETRRIPELRKELVGDVDAELQQVPELIRTRAKQVALRKVEEVCTKCYSSREYYPLGRNEVVSLTRSIVQLATADLPVRPVILFRAMEELATTVKSEKELIKELRQYSAALTLPKERIDGYTEPFHSQLLAKIDEALTSLDLFAAQAHQAAVERVVQSWDEKKASVFSMLDGIKAILEPELCIDSLLATASCHYLEPNIGNFLATPFVKLVSGFYTSELKKSDMFVYDPFRLFNFMTRETVFTSETFAKIKDKFFRRIVGPNLHIRFSQLVAEKNCSFSELLGRYEALRERWNRVHTVEEALKLLEEPASANNLPLIPAAKTEVCKDTRGFGVHLRAVDPESVHSRQIPLAVPHNPYISRNYHSCKQVGEENKIGNISYSIFATNGREKIMLDGFLATEITLQDGTKTALFAVMDGHGGLGVVEALNMSLASTVTAWLNAALQEPHPIEVAIHNAMKIAMVQLNHQFKELFKEFFQEIGSTLIFSFIYKGKIYTTSVGDSRAVASTGQQLSIDANKESQYFVEKIEKRGGTIDAEGRVDGNLLTFSTFGDFDMHHQCAYATTHYVEAHGKVRVALATDGVTELISSQDLIKMLNEGSSADQIVLNAYNKGAADNLTAIVFETEA